MWSLIPLFADHWKCKSRSFGSDLGQEKFQFQFDREDMQVVLVNRPYHFARWMVILQQWEPSISPEFSSQISFWIDAKGVHVHLWKWGHPERNWSIYQKIWELGNYSLKGKAQSICQWPQALVLSSTLEFDNGDEVTTTLVYDKFEKYYKVCFMLNHEKEDCLQNKSQANMKSTPIIPLNLLQEKNPYRLGRTREKDNRPSGTWITARPQVSWVALRDLDMIIIAYSLGTTIMIVPHMMIT